MTTILISTITFTLLIVIAVVSFYLGCKYAEGRYISKEPEKRQRETSKEEKRINQGMENILNHALRHQKAGDGK